MTRTHAKFRQGFSLLEITIVLVVVGTITAGIWTVVEGARAKNQAATLFQQVNLTVRNIREYFATQALPSVTADMGKYSEFTLRQAHVYPDDTCADVCASSLAENARNVYSGALSYNLADANSDGVPDPNSFMLRVSGLKSLGCQDLAMQLSSNYAANGLLSYKIGTNSNITSFPIALTTLDSQCDDTAGVVDVIVTLKIRN